MNDFVRKLLNLPDRDAAVEAASIGEAAGESHASSPAPKAEPSGAGWRSEPDSQARSIAKIAGRALLYLALAVIVVRGLLSFLPEETTQAGLTVEAFPTERATAVAAQTVVAYLSPELTPGERDAALALFGKADPTQIGNPVEGAEPEPARDPQADNGVRVERVIPGAVNVDDDRRGTVMVLAALVTTANEKATRRWVALSVPVLAVGDEVAVTGPPAFVGIPAKPESIPEPHVEQNDSSLAGQTRDGIGAFFTAYGTDDADAVAQASAPGANIQPAGGVMQFVRVDSWTIDAGTGDTRTGHATVTWDLAGTTLRQGYEVTLTMISAGDEESWRVSSVQADH